MSTFTPGRDLSRAFYQEILAPAIAVPHAAGLLGTGSDVLGYDTERSTDHDWGPRAVIFVASDAVAEVAARVASVLPERFRGWPVSIGRDGLPFRPQVDVATRSAWLVDRLGFDPSAADLEPADWLSLPQQRILEVVAGEVFHDDDGDLARLRALLAWYPDDVWWWMLACQWGRLAQEESLVQRTAEVGDDVGSAVTTARLVRDVMRLALLVARRYAPYSKWFGTAFSRLHDPEGLGNHLSSALSGSSHREREDALGAAYQVMAGRFNALTADLQVDAALRAFHDRPARILGANRFTEAARARVIDPRLLALSLVGSIDQVVDSVDLLTSPTLCRSLRMLWTAPPGGAPPGQGR